MRKAPAVGDVVEAKLYEPEEWIRARVVEVYEGSRGFRWETEQHCTSELLEDEGRSWRWPEVQG